MGLARCGSEVSDRRDRQTRRRRMVERVGREAEQDIAEQLRGHEEAVGGDRERFGSLARGAPMPLLPIRDR